MKTTDQVIHALPTTHKERQEQQRWHLRRVRQLLPAVCPPDLVGPIVRPDLGLPMWRLGGVRMLASVQEQPDAVEWYHVSYSREGEIPSHADTCAVRLAMFRHDACVVQVFPPVSEYVNENPHVLHLWQRLGTERLIPDLRVSAPWGATI